MAFKKAFTKTITTESFESSDRIVLDIKDLIYSLESDLDDISRTTDTVDNLIELSAVTGEIGESPSENEKKLIDIAGQFAVTGTDVESDVIVPSTESFKTFQAQINERLVISQEGLTDSLKRVWEGFKNTLKKIRMWFASFDKEMKLLQAEIQKLKSKKQVDSITINLKQKQPGEYTDSCSSYIKGLEQTSAATIKFYSSIITNGNQFVGETTTLFKNIKISAEAEKEFIDNAFDQFDKLFGVSFAKMVNLPHKADEGTVYRYSSDTLMDGNRFFIEVPKASLSGESNIAQKLMQMKRFAAGVDNKERDVESGNPNFAISFDDLERLAQSIINESRKLAQTLEGFDRVYSKMEELIHHEHQWNGDNSVGGLIVNSVMAAHSIAKGSNNLTKLNDVIGRYVIGALDTFFEVEEYLNSARKVVKQATLNTAWLKNSAE